MDPEVDTGSSLDGRYGGQPAKGRSDADPERGEYGVLRARWVRIFEQLERHLAVGLDHGFHGSLLGGVCD